MGIVTTVGPAWNFACPDWAERLKSGRSILPDLPLFEEKAAKAVAIFDNLRIPDIEGQPRFAEAAGDWFRDIVRAILGSLDDQGVRHVPELFALLGKKNSKTTNSGGLMLTALLVNEVPRGEFLFIGPTQEISDLAFQQAAGMIEADPEGYLQKRFHVQEYKKKIVDRVNKAFVKVKTFDMKVMTGSKPIGVLIDELHVMGSLHYASRVMGQIRGALESKRNSFLLIISTQSDQPPAGVFKAELQYARAVRDGTVTGNIRMLPMLFEFPESMQTDRQTKPWANPEFWPMVMPNLGRSLHLETMMAGYAAAKEKGDEEERRWASQHLNVEIGLALHSDRWIGADYFEDAADQRITLEYIEENSDVCVVGGDVGGLEDLWGLAVLGRHKKTRHWMLWVRAWVQPIVFQRRKEIAERLMDFVKDGDLWVCKHVTEDAEQAAKIIVRLRDKGLLPETGAVGLDPAGVTALLEELASYDIVAPMVAGVSQGYKLSSAIFGVERKLADGTLKHSGSALLTWCVDNARAEMRGSNVYIEKKSASAKIDPLVAAFNAAEMMSRNPVAFGAPVDFDALIKNAMVV